LLTVMSMVCLWCVKRVYISCDCDICGDCCVCTTVSVMSVVSLCVQ
jgi:hypothetical protein